VVIFAGNQGEEFRLQEVEGPCSGNGLCAALHSQFATEVINVPLDRIDTEDKATGDLAVGSAFQQQAQHLALALSQRFSKRTGASRGVREV
jgi:hypothetical protein